MILNDMIEVYFFLVNLSLNKSVLAYSKRWKNIKIGITCDPERRAKEHAKAGIWKKMVVKYETSSVNFINKMEQNLIENHWTILVNEVAGGGGPNAKTGPY